MNFDKVIDKVGPFLSIDISLIIQKVFRISESFLLLVHMLEYFSSILSSTLDILKLKQITDF